MANEKVYLKETKAGSLALYPCASPGDNVIWVNLTNEDCTVAFSGKSPFSVSSIDVPPPPSGGFQGQSLPVQVNSSASGSYKYTCTTSKSKSTANGEIRIAPVAGAASEKICISETSNQLQLSVCAAAQDVVTWLNSTDEDYTMANFNPASPQIFPNASIPVPQGGSSSAQVNNGVALGTPYAYTCSPSATGGQIIIVDSTKPNTLLQEQQSQEQAELVGVSSSR